MSVKAQKSLVMDIEKHLSERIAYLKKIEWDYFEKSVNNMHGGSLRIIYRNFSNEFQARRNELEELLKCVSKDGPKARKV